MKLTNRIQALGAAAIFASALYFPIQAVAAPYLRPAGFSSVKVGGELETRLHRNMARLEEERYQPHKVFLTEEQSGNWPGDTEGRTILGLVMDARASGREPIHLTEILRRIPPHLNERGYFGTIHRDSLDEQQLSGNGWVLRGLCEYYTWKRDPSVLPIIKSISENLFLEGHSLMGLYPINPSERSKTGGGASGNVGQIIGKWRLSTDIGCVFIGMDGLIHAYEVTRNPKLRPVIETLIQRFLAVDLVGIKAQTHASLTAMRGLMRYATIAGNRSLLSEVEKRWQDYKRYGMTENFANYNWFCRYDTWTEPCAIVDSYMVATQLWQHTGKPEYLDDAELIYYNAICHGQRDNGGFGTDMCPGHGYGHPSVAVSGYEAYWCCTMRGAEGLSRAAENVAFVDGNTLCLPFYSNAAISVAMGKKGRFKLTETTLYPFSEGVQITVDDAPGSEVSLMLGERSWMKDFAVTVNGAPVATTLKNGSRCIKRRFKAGDCINISFTMAPRAESTLNPDNTSPESFKMLCGPLLLAASSGCEEGFPRNAKLTPLTNNAFRVEGTGVTLSPLYHLMSGDVSQTATIPYSRRVIF